MRESLARHRANFLLGKSFGGPWLHASRKQFLFDRLCEPVAQRKGGGGGAVAATDLVEDAGQVIGDGMVAERQFAGDLPVAQASRNEAEHLGLAPRQSGRQSLWRRHTGLRWQVAQSVAGASQLGRHAERLAAAQRRRQRLPRLDRTLRRL